MRPSCTSDYLAIDRVVTVLHPKTLHLHSSGPQVRALQLLLRTYEPWLAVDGRFGPKTEHAVRTAQRRLDIFPADGLAGTHTMAALAHASAATQHRQLLQHSMSGMGDRVGGWTSRAGAMVATAGHEALETVEQAVSAIEAWIAGLHPQPAKIPPVLHPVVPPAREKARREAAPQGDVADPKNMLMSEPGRRFVFRHEAGNGHATAHLHHPPGHSGVTIGPGYDMKERSAAEVADALRKVGVDAASADTASRGAGLHDAAAGVFAHDNKQLLNLTLGQQIALQNYYKGHYEQMVRYAVRIPLHQYEFDALVSFAGNPGTRTIWHTTTRLVNEHRPHDAAAEFFKAVHTGDPRLTQGLVNRRAAESKLFLYGNYAA